MGSKLNKPFKHIEKIQREFGIGRKGYAIENRTAKSLHQAITQLSENLYTKDIHFILELIQNAEDNQYEEGIEPQLDLYFLDDDPSRTPGSDGALLLINNETGFNKENVEAICAIGATTKKKREGYIGEKGIGFKSTFLVSSQPHIISAGYQFKFMEEKDPEAGFGYIVPYWVPNSNSLFGGKPDKTRILLPLKAEKRINVVDQLKQIAPETILFLRKLKSLIIKVENDLIAEVVRDDHEKPIISFHVANKEAKYWLIEERFAVPKDIVEDKREGIYNRVISIAFPISDPDKLGDTIYAYLPTLIRSGFNFLVNGDFILSSNRESIRENLSWNIWLRDCIGPTFVKAFESLLNNSKYKFEPYLFIPNPDEIRDPYFQPVVDTIIKELKERTTIWTHTGRKLVKPENARFASKTFRALIKSRSRLKQFIDTPIIHSKLEEPKIKEQLRLLGVKDISHNEILNCFRDENWLNKQDLSWFIQLYEYLINQYWANFDILKGLKIIPLDGGGRKAVSSHGVYFPTEQAIELVKSNSEIIHFLDIDFLDHNLFQLVEENSTLINWLKSEIGVRDLTANSLCVKIAIDLNNQKNSTKPDKLIELTRFIMNNLHDLDSEDKGIIKRHLPLLTSSDEILTPQIWTDANPLVMPENLDSKTGWQFVFPNILDRNHMTILSNSYLGKKRKDKNLWYRLFQILGATDTPLPMQRFTKFFFYSVPEEIPTYIVDWLKGKWTNHECTLQDRVAPYWLIRLQINPTSKINPKSPSALLKWLERHYQSNDWQLKSEDRVHITYKTPKNTYYFPDPPQSEFIQYLLNSPWFPTTKGRKIPNQVFIDKQEIREFFGNSLPYSQYDLDEMGCEFLNVRKSASSSEVIEVLKSFASTPASQVDHKLVSRIYAFLAERWNENLEEEFNNNKLILSIKPSPSWRSINEVLWPDLSSVFGNLYVYLASQYEQSLMDFFVNKLDVAKNVDNELYAQAWINLCEKNEQDPLLIESALERIYPVLLKVAGDQDKPKWWEEFISNVLVWTQRNHFVDTSIAYIPDDGELKKILQEEEIEFVWLPPKDSFLEYWPLYEEIGVGSLTENVAISTEIDPLEIEDDEDGNFLLTNGAKWAICYYLRNKSKIKYQSLKDEGLIEQLLKLHEVKVNKLILRYSIDFVSTSVDDGVAFWDQGSNSLYLSTNHDEENWETEIPAIIARHLIGTKSSIDLEHFIGRVLGASDNKFELIVNKQNWSIPISEKEWLDELLLEEDQEVEPDEEDLVVDEFIDDDIQVLEEELWLDTIKEGLDVDFHPPASPTPGIKKKFKGKQPKDQNRDRLRSYVIHSGRSSNGSNIHERSQENKNKIERFGIHVAMNYEKQNGRYSYELTRTHEGWDINVFPSGVDNETAKTGEGTIRKIEVKATEYAWDGYGIYLTAPEHRAAQKYADEYYLYVVEKALSDDYQLHIFQNPAELIDEYRFDDNWKSISIKADISGIPKFVEDED